MSDFDPYHKWLQIPPKEQPPNHYRLLGLALFEPDPDVIDNAAEQRLLHLKSAQNGPKGAIAQRIMNEVSQARVTLLNVEQRSQYDEQLKKTIAPEPGPKPSVPSAPAVTVSTRKTSHSIKYARQRKNSALMISGLVAVLLILIGGVIFMMSRGGDSEQSNKVASKSKDQKQNNKVSDKTKTKKFESPKRKSDASKDQSKDRPKIDQQIDRTKNPNNIQKGSPKVRNVGPQTQTTNNNTTSKSPPTPRTNPSPKNALNELFDQTFSLQSESKLAVGEPIAMLPLLKLPENLKQGVVRKVNNKLVFESNASVNLVDFPLILPPHYDLNATVTRLTPPAGTKSPDDGFGIGIHVANHPCLFAIDHFPQRGYLTGPRQFNNMLTSSIRTDVVRGRVLDFDKPTKIKLQVRPTGIRMYANGDKIYEFKGSPKNLKFNPQLMPGTRNQFQLHLMSWKTRFQIEDVELIPKGPAAQDDQWFAKSTVKEAEKLGRPVDLIAKFKPEHVFTMPVRKDRFGIAIGPKKRLAGFEVPMEIADEYDLRMNVRAAGPEGLIVCLPVADRQAMLVIDYVRRRNGRLETRTAMELVNGRKMDDLAHPGMLPVKLLNNQRESQLDIKVRYDSIRLYVDGKFSFGWSGSRYRLSVPSWHGLQIDRSELKLRVLSMDDPVLIKKFSYRPVTETERLPDKYDELVARVQQINPSLIEFWKEYEALANQGQASNMIQLPSKTGQAVNVTKQTSVDPDPGIAIDPQRLKLPLLSKVEMADFDRMIQSLDGICQNLKAQKFKEADEAIVTLEKSLATDPAKQCVAAIKQISEDIQSFWQVIPQRMSRLKPTQQLEFSDSAAIVLSASSDQLRIRSGGEIKSYQPEDLPLGIAMKIFDMTTNNKDTQFLRKRGSVFYLASKHEPRYRPQAIQFWLDAEKQGAKIDDLLLLVSE